MNSVLKMQRKLSMDFLVKHKQRILQSLPKKLGASLFKVSSSSSLSSHLFLIGHSAYNDKSSSKLTQKSYNSKRKEKTTKLYLRKICMRIRELSLPHSYHRFVVFFFLIFFFCRFVDDWYKRLLKSTFSGHFVAGETQEEVR